MGGLARNQVQGLDFPTFTLLSFFAAFSKAPSVWASNKEQIIGLVQAKDAMRKTDMGLARKKLKVTVGERKRESLLRGLDTRAFSVLTEYYNHRKKNFTNISIFKTLQKY